MKKITLLVTFLVVFTLTNLTAQPTKGGEITLHWGEIIIDLSNYGTYWDVTFKFSKLFSPVWDEDHYITSSYNQGNYRCYYLGGFDSVVTAYFDVLEPNSNSYSFGIGKYKIQALIDGVEAAKFYMDFRTSSIPDEGTPDIYFVYDVANEQFKYGGSNINNLTKTYWQLGGLTYSTTNLEPYAPNNMAITSYNSHPKITWSRQSYYDYVEGFDVYRSFEGPHSGFTKIGSTDYDVFEYVDNSVHVGPGDLVYYKVKAVNGNRESDYSSIVSINYDGISKEGAEKKVWTFELSQNYPNPFNPSTVINYQIPEDGFVNLTVYNSIGEKVAVLVNTQQSQGYYNIEFNADNLSSGIYFYRLTANNYSSIKKMTLVR